jgi:ABC-type multidrug transport system fused ATPase/permease subunit
MSDIRVKLARALPQLEIVGNFLKRGAYTAKSGSVEISVLKKGIHFDNVSFCYPNGSKDVLRNISFSIPVGNTIALVGASGAGKSTIADLLIGLFKVDRGSIVIDGEDSRNVSQGQWREKIGVVEQNVFLLNTSILENIRFARPEASVESIVNAAKIAQAHGFIERLDNGYDTVIGDRGYGLSGGQQQRISLARALIRNPQLLILDEATSSLDTESERMIQEAIDSMHSMRTILVIAHRLSTIVNADQIILLEDGEILERGTQKELLVKGGRFAELWSLQDANQAD